METKYTVELTEEELKAIGLICSYFRHPHPLSKLDRDIGHVFGEPDFGRLEFEVFETQEENGRVYDNVLGRFEEVVVDWPEDWQKAWEDYSHKVLKRNNI